MLLKIDDLIINFLEIDLIDNKNNKIIFTDNAKKIIHEIAIQAKYLSIIKISQNKINKYVNENTAEEIYLNLLVKIKNAPTIMQMKTSAYINIYALDKRLKQEEEKTK